MIINPTHLPRVLASCHSLSLSYKKHTQKMKNRNSGSGRISAKWIPIICIASFILGVLITSRFILFFKNFFKLIIWILFSIFMFHSLKKKRVSLVLIFLRFIWIVVVVCYCCFRKPTILWLRIVGYTGCGPRRNPTVSSCLTVDKNKSYQLSPTIAILKRYIYLFTIKKILSPIFIFWKLYFVFEFSSFYISIFLFIWDWFLIKIRNRHRIEM